MKIIVAKIRKLDKTMIKHSFYTNYLWFSLRFHDNKILHKDLQLKSKIMTKRSKTILQRVDKLLLKERIYINHVIRGRLKNSMEQLKAKTPEEFHLVQKIHQNLYKKSFDLAKKEHIWKFDELISKKKGTKSATSITKEMGY